MEEDDLSPKAQLAYAKYKSSMLKQRAQEHGLSTRVYSILLRYGYCDGFVPNREKIEQAVDNLILWAHRGIGNTAIREICAWLYPKEDQ